MTTGNENSPLTRSASGQKNGTAIEARGLSSADNGMTAENISQRKGPAPKQASEAADQRPSTENSTAESIVGVRAAAAYRTSSKVGRAEALTYRLTEFDVLLDGYQESLQVGPLKERVDARNELRLAYRTALLAASPVEQPAAAPMPRYTEAMGTAAQAYLERVVGRDPKLPIFWADLWAAMLGAAESLHPAAAPIDADVDAEVDAAARQYEGIPLDVARGLARAAILAATPDESPAPSPADERAAWDNAHDSHAVAMAGFAAQSGNRDFNAAITVLDAITEPALPLSLLRTDRAASANETVDIPSANNG